MKKLSREQFSKLREARVLIKEEFSTTISLGSDDVFDEIYKYALESETEDLFHLHETLLGIDPSQPDTQPASAKVEPPKSRGKVKLQVGDIVDGKRVVQFYRGAPVFE